MFGDSSWDDGVAMIALVLSAALLRSTLLASGCGYPPLKSLIAKMMSSPFIPTCLMPVLGPLTAPPA